MKPILFNTEMVQAILNGDKTQTRRINKMDLSQLETDTNDKNYLYLEDEYGESHHLNEYAPYKTGDILYVRETWQKSEYFDYSLKNRYFYKADFDSEELQDIKEREIRWRPSIHMPKIAARLFLEVINVRAQGIQDITNEEVLKEGMKSYTKDNLIFKYALSDEWWEDYCVKHRKQFRGTPWQEMPQEPQQAFKYLWNSCYNYPKSWVCNPWVWVIEFEKIDKPNEGE